MATITTDAFKALALVANGSPTARWNFPLAAGTPLLQAGGLGAGVDLRYSFLAVNPASDPQRGFLAFTADQQAATRAVLQRYADVANLRFSLDATDAGQLGFANSTQTQTQLGFARFPEYSYTLSSGLLDAIVEQPGAGTVWLNRTSSAADTSPGQRVFFTLLHELGHALGLKHPFSAGANGFVLDGAQNNLRYTVMAYSPALNSLVYEISGRAGDYSVATRPVSPSSLMLLDITALQTLYGANTASHNGDDVYRWGRNAELLETLWDGAGSDTIDCSNQTLRCEVNLTPGSFSSIALRLSEADKRAALDLPSWFTEALDERTYDGQQNLAIARGCWIENAIGGRAADSLRGNARDNLLDGRGGADTLIGGAGDDRYAVDRAEDRVVELAGGGVDLVLASASYTLPAFVEQGRILASGAVDLRGNALGNLLYAGAGDNRLDGAGGADAASYAFATAGVSLSLALDGAQATGGSGRDTLLQIERLYGSAYADRLTGNGGANVLAGGAGNDTLRGGDGNDLLLGGAGRDRLAGGEGADRFRFDVAPGAANRDLIEDFAPGADLLQLDRRVFTALGPPGALPAGYWRLGTSALDTDDFLLYDRPRGELAYDPDANGPQAPLVFAWLTPGLAFGSQQLELV